MEDVRLLEVLDDAAAAVKSALDRLEEWGPTGGKPGQYHLDLAADAAALPVLHGAGLAVLSEESGVSGDGPSGLLAVIDPVDGSTNAHRRVPFYSTSICVLDDGRTRVGLVRNHANGDRFAAVRRGGADKNGGAISPSACDQLRKAIVGISGFPGTSPGWAQFRALGAASLELLRSCRGRARRVHGGRPRAPCFGWDYLAGLLVCREVGGGRRRTARGASSWSGTHRAGRPFVAATRALADRWPARIGLRTERRELRAPAPCVLRKTWRTLEPLHGMVYFVPEAAEAYAHIGVTGRAGYFASRAAPMGAVTAEVVVSTFFNLNPELVYAAIPAAWEPATPGADRRPQFGAVDDMFGALSGRLSSIRGDGTGGTSRSACRGGGGPPAFEGRPLAAAHADIPWPSDPHLALWHAQSMLREYRGDGHIALLVVRALGDRVAGHDAGGGGRPGACVAVDPGLARRRLAGGRSMHYANGGGWSGASQLRFSEWGADPTSRDRGRDRRPGGGALRSIGGRWVRGVAGIGAPMEPALRRTSGLMRPRGSGGGPEVPGSGIIGPAPKRLGS